MTYAFQIADAFQAGAFQEEIISGDFAFQECAFQFDAFQADTCPNALFVEYVLMSRRLGRR